MIYLLTFLLNHSSPITLNAWACNAVYDLRPQDDGGCYDICYALADTCKVSGPQDDLATCDYPHALENACAVVMHGGEY